MTLQGNEEAAERLPSELYASQAPAKPRSPSASPTRPGPGRHRACAAAAPPQPPGDGSGPGPGAERGGMASLVPAAASSPAGAASRSKKRPASPGTGGGPAKKKKATAPGGSQHSGIGGAAAGKKNRTWKNLKQILASERALPWQLNDPSYFNIDAPPSFKPAKKYSDISGLPANYTDPQSKLRFSTIEEFAYIRMLPSDVVTGYLALRKATSIVS
ncbi:INO80 complex subunit C isoform X2 [Agelaius tricolor]